MSWTRRRTDNSVRCCPAATPVKPRLLRRHPRQHGSTNGTIEGYYCPSRNSSPSRPDVIATSQCYEDSEDYVSWRRRNRNRTVQANDEQKSRSKSRDVGDGSKDSTIDNEKGRERIEDNGTKDQNQLNTIGDYLSYNNDNCRCLCRYPRPEQDTLSNVQWNCRGCFCWEKPLTYKSGRRSNKTTPEWNSLVLRLLLSVFLLLAKSIGQLTTGLIQWICRNQFPFVGIPSYPHSHCWSICPVSTVAAIEFTSTGQHQHHQQKRMLVGQMRSGHLSSWCFCPTVIVILLRNVFIAGVSALNANLIVPIAVGFCCCCANYAHCPLLAKCRSSSTCGTINGTRYRYHQQRQSQQVVDGVLSTLRQFEGSLDGQEDALHCRITSVLFRYFTRKSASSALGIGAVVSAFATLTSQRPWRRRRRKGTEPDLPGQTEEKRQNQRKEQVEMIVAKENRKLLNFPGDFYKKSQLLARISSRSSKSSNRGRPVKRISGLIADDNSFDCSSAIESVWHRQMPMGQAPKAANATRITGKSANPSTSSSWLLEQCGFQPPDAASLVRWQPSMQRESIGGTVVGIRCSSSSVAQSTQSIATAHQGDRDSETGAIESSYQELSCVQCGYNNYAQTFLRGTSRVHCCCVTPGDNQKQMSLSVRLVRGGGGGENVAAGPAEQLSKATVIYIRLVVKLIAIIIILVIRIRRSLKSIPVPVLVTKSRSRNRSWRSAPGGGDGGWPGTSVTETIQVTTTIRVIIHGPEEENHSRLSQEEQQEVENATAVLLSKHSRTVVIVMVVVVVVLASDTCDNARIQWSCRRLHRNVFSAISPFPFQTETSLTCFGIGTTTTQGHYGMATEENSSDRWKRTRRREFKRMVVMVVAWTETLSSSMAVTVKAAAESESVGAVEGTLKCPNNWTEGDCGMSSGRCWSSSVESKRKSESNSAQKIKLKPVFDAPVAPGCCPAAFRRRHLVLLLTVAIISVVNLPLVSCLTASQLGSGAFKYSTNVVKTKYGPLRGIVLRSHPVVEAYLGVPYATPPVGSLR